jgi:polyisoprenoid-binding protein YceI
MATKTNWTIDPSHSEIAFNVRHLMIANVRGVFTEFKAKIETIDFDFATALVNFTLASSSVSTGDEKRDAHLKSPDFFDSEKYKEITFKSDSIKKVDADSYVMVGSLTIKGISKQISLNVEFGGLMTDPWGNKKAGFSINGKVNRKDWGLLWNAALESGGVLVADEVRIIADVELQEVKA